MTRPKNFKTSPSTADDSTRPLLSWGVAAPLLGYLPSLALWIILGPLGAGAAASGHWARACVQAALLGAGLACFADGYVVLWGALEGPDMVAEALANGLLSPGRALLSMGLLIAATLVWAQELWLLRAWHGLAIRNPLLGDPD